MMPDLIQTRFSITLTPARIAVIGVTIQRHERELDQARPGAPFDFDDALADPESVQKRLILPCQKQSPSGRKNVVFVLQAEKYLTIAIAQDVNGHEGGMLGDADHSLAESPDFPEDVFEAVGGLVLGLGAGKQVVDFLQECHMAQPVGFTLSQAIEMNPPEQDVAQEDAQGFGQFLVQFNDDRPVQQLLQFQWLPGVKRARSRAEGERAQDSEATVLPEHAPAAVLHPVQFLGGVKEVRILLYLPVVKSEFLKLFVQGFDQNVRHTGTGEM